MWMRLLGNDSCVLAVMGFLVFSELALYVCVCVINMIATEIKDYL